MREAATARPAAREEPRSSGTPEEELPPPTGTLFLMTLYLAALGGMWGAMYLMLLSR